MGSPNIPIKFYYRRFADGGTVEIFVQDILGGQAFGSNVEFISTTTQALQKLAGSPGSIYYASCPRGGSSMFNQALAVGADARAVYCSLPGTICPPV